MTLKEVCAYLRISVRTVHRRIKSGELPALKVGGQWRFKREDIEKYLREKQFHYGTAGIKHFFFRPQVLNRYKKASKSGQKYYLHNQAFDGRVGNRQDYHDIKTLTSMKRKLPKGYKPFVDIHYRKVTLKDGMLAIVLKPDQYKNLPNIEQKHWVKFAISHPHL